MPTDPNQPIPNGSTGFKLPPARSDNAAAGLLGDLVGQFLNNLVTGGGTATGVALNGASLVIDANGAMTLTDAAGNILKLFSDGTPGDAFIGLFGALGAGLSVADIVSFFSNDNCSLQMGGGQISLQVVGDNSLSLTPTQAQVFQQLTTLSSLVSDLPIGIDGSIAYATNGLKIGETPGSGTGVMVYFSNGQWLVFSTDTPVAA